VQANKACCPAPLTTTITTTTAPLLAHPGIPELVAKLQSQGKGVFLVSGGFRQVIHPIAESLNIPVSNVFANQLLFKVGRYCRKMLLQGVQHSPA